MQFQGIRMYNICTPQMNTKKAERNSQLTFSRLERSSLFRLSLRASPF